MQNVFCHERRLQTAQYSENRPTLDTGEVEGRTQQSLLVTSEADVDTLLTGETHKTLTATGKNLKLPGTETTQDRQTNDVTPADLPFADAEINAQTDGESEETPRTDAIDKFTEELWQQTQMTLTEDDYMNDPEFGCIYLFLKTGELTGNTKIDKRTLLMIDQYFIKDELLFRLKLPKNKKQQTLLLERLCIPKVFRGEILFRFHDLISHHGVQKTFQSLSARFFWQSLFLDVHQYIKTCDMCQRTKKNYSFRRPPLNPLEIPQKPFTHWSLDHKMLSRKTKTGNVAILCCVEIFSNWPVLIPVPDLSAFTTAKMLVKYIISVFGVPLVINSDRGSSFTAQIFQYIIKFFHIRHRISASRSARSNGAAEQLVPVSYTHLTLPTNREV